MADMTGSSANGGGANGGASSGGSQVRRNFAGFFRSTDPAFFAKALNDAAGADSGNNMVGDSGGINELSLDTLRAYKEHPFKPYSGQRFDDMVASIRDNGVIVPIIVRPIMAAGDAGAGNYTAGGITGIGMADGIAAIGTADAIQADTPGGAAATGAFGESAYEILSGHNRVAAAKAAGLDAIPAIMREGLTDEDALLIVTETNLIQRSFADMSHSERAVTLSTHHEAIKKQGKRTDLIAEIESLLSGDNASNGAENSTLGTTCQKIDSRKQVGQQYDMSSRTVAHYLRINKLLDPFKERLDSGELAIRAAVTLSYLSADEQQAVDYILSASAYRLDMKKAEALRTAAERRKLDHAAVEEILSGAKKPKAPRPAAFKLKPKIMARYFTPEQKPQEIEDTITKALEYYFTHIHGKRSIGGEYGDGGSDYDDGEEYPDDAEGGGDYGGDGHER